MRKGHPRTPLEIVPVFAYSPYASSFLTTYRNSSHLITFIMKFSTAVATLVFAATALAAPSASSTVTVSFDQAYDNSAASLDTVSCSNGPNGLESQGNFIPISSALQT